MGLQTESRGFHICFLWMAVELVLSTVQGGVRNLSRSSSIASWTVIPSPSHHPITPRYSRVQRSVNVGLSSPTTNSRNRSDDLRPASSHARVSRNLHRRTPTRYIPRDSEEPSAAVQLESGAGFDFGNFRFRLHDEMGNSTSVDHPQFSGYCRPLQSVLFS